MGSPVYSSKTEVTESVISNDEALQSQPVKQEVAQNLNSSDILDEE